MSIYLKLVHERAVLSHLNRAVRDFSFAAKDKHPALAYFEPIDILSEGLPVPIFGAMLLIWQLRDQDLQLLYPLDSVESRLKFLAWCTCSGLKEYGLLRECQPFLQALARPAFVSHDYPESDAAHGLSCLMVLTAIHRPDLEVDITTASGRARLLLWYLQHGFSEAGIVLSLEKWQTRFLASSLNSDTSRHQRFLYEARKDLQEAFPLPAAQQHFNTWYATSVEFHAFVSLQQRHQDFSPAGRITPADFGINVIGYVSGTSGIAEDSRSALAALRCTTLQTVAIDFSAATSPSSAGDHPYAINLFCFPALEQARYVAEKGLSAIVDHYNIGYWPWEISHWPEQWNHLFSLVDEVWASSEHIKSALLPVTPKPVLSMPMVVESPPVSYCNRSDFSLPDDVFLFYFSFDLRSSSVRKNPEACISAFLKAFPRSSSVGLVIKALKPLEDNKAWKKLVTLSRQDKRIHVIDQTLSRSDLMALYASCDCFVSLHRAEGFGRNIAEAMLLGNPVIATGYSGNLTFTNERNSLIVPYELKKIGKGDYPGVLDGVWAEPDVDAAAASMTRIVEDSRLTDKLRAAGRHTMLDHSAFRIAQRYLARLAIIKKTMNINKNHDLV